MKLGYCSLGEEIKKADFEKIGPFVNGSLPKTLEEINMNVKDFQANNYLIMPIWLLAKKPFINLKKPTFHNLYRNPRNGIHRGRFNPDFKIELPSGHKTLDSFLTSLGFERFIVQSDVLDIEFSRFVHALRNGYLGEHYHIIPEQIATKRMRDTSLSAFLDFFKTKEPKSYNIYADANQVKQNLNKFSFL